MNKGLENVLEGFTRREVNDNWVGLYQHTEHLDIWVISYFNLIIVLYDDTHLLL